MKYSEYMDSLRPWFWRAIGSKVIPKDKAKALAESLGVPVPRTIETNGGYVFKPINGHSGQGVVVVRDPSAYMLEELIIDEDGSIPPRDFKCFVFRGRFRMVKVTVKGEGTRRVGFYRWPDWHRLRLAKFDWLECDAPSCASDIARYAELIASRIDIPAIRVDFYASTRGAVFGELCATDGDVSGKQITAEADRMMGRWLDD